MIEGDGFFQLLLPDGSIGYTRDGNFKIDGEGRIVNNDGYVLQPEIWVPGKCHRYYHWVRWYGQRSVGRGRNAARDRPD